MTIYNNNYYYIYYYTYCYYFLRTGCMNRQRARLFTQWLRAPLSRSSLRLIVQFRIKNHDTFIQG